MSFRRYDDTLRLAIMGLFFGLLFLILVCLVIPALVPEVTNILFPRKNVIVPEKDMSTQCSRFNYQDDVSCVLCSDPGTKATVLSCVKAK